MLLYELRKIIFNKGVIILFILAVVVKLFIAYIFIANADERYNQFYDEYTALLYRKTPAQKVEMIEKEKKRLENILFQKDRSNNNLLTEKEYQSQLYMECLYREQPFKKVALKVSNVKKAVDLKEFAISGSYLTSINTPDDFMKNLELYKAAPIPDIIPDRGWDFFIYIAKWNFFSILLLVGLSRVFSSEYESGMHRLLLSTVKGHGMLFRKKLTAAVIFTSAIAIFFTILDLSLGATAGPLRGWDAPVCSLDAFYHFIANITIWQYLLIYFLMKLFIGLCSACIILCISSVSKKVYSALTGGVCVFGISAFVTVSFKGVIDFFLFGIVNVHQLFSNFKTVAIAGIRIPVLYLSLIFCGILIVFLIIVTSRRYKVYPKGGSAL